MSKSRWALGLGRNQQRLVKRLSPRVQEWVFSVPKTFPELTIDEVILAYQARLTPKRLREVVESPEQTGGRSLPQYIRHRYRIVVGEEPQEPKRPAENLAPLVTHLLKDWKKKIQKRQRRREKIKNARRAAQSQ